MNFTRFFIEQSFAEVFGWFVGVAAVYLLLFAALTLTFSRGRVSRRWVVTSLVAAGIVLTVFLVGLTLFEAAALYYRVTPPGEGIQRQGKDLASFYFQFKVAFVLLYASAIALAAAVGHFAGRRFAGSGRAVAALTLVALFGFLLLTFPRVEFQNACDIGDSLFIEAHC